MKWAFAKSVAIAVVVASLKYIITAAAALETSLCFSFTSRSVVGWPNDDWRMETITVIVSPKLTAGDHFLSSADHIVHTFSRNISTVWWHRRANFLAGKALSILHLFIEPCPRTTSWLAGRLVHLSLTRLLQRDIQISHATHTAALKPLPAGQPACLGLSFHRLRQI